MEGDGLRELTERARSASLAVDDQRVMALVLGLSFLAGGALLAAAAALPHRDTFDEIATAALATIALAVGALLVLLRRRLPPVTLRGFVVVALGGISLSILAFDDPRSDNELFFLLPVFYAFWYFNLREAVACAALATIGYAIPASSVDSELELYRVLSFSAVLVIDGALVRLLAVRVRRLLGDLERAARTDPLTGLLNRRGFNEQTEQALARARRDGSSLALLVGDLDQFKLVNDRLGHPAGDGALQRTAALIDRNKRTGDIASRLGGDEFALLLVGSNREQATALARRLRADIEAEFAADRVSPTISLGVAAFPHDGDELESLLTAADRGSYAGKALGRNRVVGDPKAADAALAGTPLGRSPSAAPRA
jgi:diguanylate cyclase (GGDEF)-like protein